MFEDYGESMDVEMDSLQDVGNEAETDAIPAEMELEPDTSGESIENIAETEELPPQPELAEDLQEGKDRFEADFEDRIDSMTLADLKEERERLLEMGAMSGDEIAEQYKSERGGQNERDATDRFLDNLDKDQLSQMRDMLSDLGNGDGENSEGTDDTDDEPPRLKLTLKKTLI